MLPYPTKVYLDDKILDQEDAKISVFDRGFLFGDGIYEVMVQIDGKMFLGKEHLDRLEECLRKIDISFNVESIDNKISDLLKASKLTNKDCLVYIQVTRGTAPRKHAFPENIEPTFMMYAVPISLPEVNEIHASVITVPDFRWTRCDIKMTSLLGNVMANTDAFRQGAYEALLVRDGKITEASHSNVFFVKDKVVYTHPANEFILDGITRKSVLKLCKDLGIEVQEKAIDQDEIAHLDEAFLTGTTTQVASIRKIDDHELYQNGNTGPITKALQTAFLQLRRQSEPILTN